MNSKPLSVALEEAFIECRDMDVSLAEKLQAFADAVRRLAPNFQEAVDKLVARLKDHEVGKNAPKPGEQMPSFVLPDQNAQLVSLDKILEHGPVQLHSIADIGALIAASTRTLWPRRKDRLRRWADRSPPSCLIASISPPSSRQSHKRSFPS